MTISLPQDGGTAVGIQQSQRLRESLSFSDGRNALIIGFLKFIRGLVGAPTGEMPIFAVAKQAV
jgi:hypothetical protein